MPSEGRAAWSHARAQDGPCWEAWTRKVTFARQAAVWGGRPVPETRSPRACSLMPSPGNRDPRATAYSLRKSLSWRLNLSRSSAELCRPKSSGAGGSKPRGSEHIAHGLRLARRAGIPSGAHSGRRLRSWRRLWSASGSRHFPGRARLLPAERSFIEMPETDRARNWGRPSKRAGAEVTSPQKSLGLAGFFWMCPLLSRLFA